ncbi:hypothetical protein HK099_008568 [Clydaea vesicula]|uniref:UDP-N-acetylglucosamine transferase subunit ALG13 n=1 Tax=Clydaea vesicula TaxID=447962 RepID=A0AAD5TVP5_9FUNG|nr:hypothetical protein HK099_008568 [Clydaea vesicula]
MVRSTRFDKLIELISSESFVELLHELKFTSVTVQHGGSPFTLKTIKNIVLKAFSYSDEIGKYFEKADLIVSHAGSGSILEALELNKPLLVVVNDGLMNNHQSELAEILNRQGVLLKTNIQDFFEKFKLINDEGFKFTAMESSDPDLFVKALKNLVGLK